MSDRRAKNAEIFKDTEYMYRTNKALKDTVESSIRNQQILFA